MTTTAPTTATTITKTDETTIAKTTATSIVSKAETATAPKVEMVTASDKTLTAECAPDVPSAVDGGRGEENGVNDADPPGDIALLGAPDIGRALNSAGPVVTVVVLLCGDGAADDGAAAMETKIDTTPKLAEVRRLLLDGVGGGSGKEAGDRPGPSFVGQYAEEDAVLVCLNQQHPHTASLPLNPHVLVPPLNGVPVRGNMVVMRVGHDADATPGDYTKGQYEDFLARRNAAVADGSYVIGAKTTAEGEDGEGDEDEDGDDEIADVDDEDGEDDGEDEEDEDEEDEDEEDEGEFNSEDMVEMLMAQVVRKHRLQNDGEDPTEEQLETFKRVILEKFGVVEDVGEGKEAEEEDGGDVEEGGGGEKKGVEEKASKPLPQALSDDQRDAKRDAADAGVDAGTVTAAGDAKRVRVSD